MNTSYAYVPNDPSARDLDYLRVRGVTDFVHFTTADNLYGILRNGLLPRSDLEKLSIEYTGTDVLRLEGKDVVNLSISNPNIRMFYGKRKDLSDHPFAVLTLDPVLLKDIDGAYEFSSTNAASRLSQPCSVEEIFAGDRPSFFEPNWPTDNQAEVLVRSVISPSHIKTIQFPYSDVGNSKVETIANEVANLVRRLGLRCVVLFCNRHFDYNQSVLGLLAPKERYERYFVSWMENERAAVASERAIELIEKEKIFDSVAFLSNKVADEEVHPDREAKPYAVWSLRYRSPSGRSRRSNAQLSAFAVLEKIVHRGRVTRLSLGLERQLTTNGEAVYAHQAQCTIVELVKYQVLKPGSVVCCDSGGRYSEIFGMALEDLKELSRNVCKLYDCDDFLSNVYFTTIAAGADVVVRWSNDSGDLKHREARISGLRKTTSALPFDFTRVVEPVPITPDYEALRFLLRYIFRFDSFREGQLEAVRRGLRRRDTIVLLPTGSGKSIVFQLLSLITPGFSFVVCPIISLIEDQVTNLRLKGIDRVMGLSSAMNSNARASVMEGLTTGQHLMCYVAPERFQDRSFNGIVKRYASTNLISTVVVDEAHCVSEWGHEFRTSYLGLARTCREVCRTGAAIPPLLALTGTASTSVLIDMMNDLGISDEDAIIQPASFDRPEIHYRVIRVPSKRKMEALEEIVHTLIPSDFSANPQGFYAPIGEQSNCGIVFCQNVNGSYGLMASDRQIATGYLGVWDFLNSRLPGLCSYYSGKAPARLSMSDRRWNDEKRAQASSFKSNTTTVMVATKAFGMGIDKPNVRWVVHFGMPSSLESYYQEVGRAARDRKVAYAYLLLSDDFHSLNEELLDPARTPVTELSTKGERRRGRWNGDDISRISYLHSQTFLGAERELQAAREILDACERENFRGGQWYVPFSKEAKESMERAIYRFRLIGVFEGYAIDYVGQDGFFVIRPSGYRGQALRSHAIESYLAYIAAYQPDESYVNASRTRVESFVSGAVNDRDFIMRVMEHLLRNFVYKVLEEGRRRATWTMLDAANSAVDAGGGDATDRELRRRMLTYLSADNQGGKRRGIRVILNDATNLGLILKVMSEGKWADLLGQSSRLLEDYPEHYGLHFIQAATHALSGDAARFKSSLKSMVVFGERSYGLSRERCKSDFVRFLNSPVSREMQAETIDVILSPMAECFGCTKEEMLGVMTSPQAKMLKEIDVLYRIAADAMEGLQWIQAK